MRAKPNPQGKGLVPVLQGLQQHWSREQVVPKHFSQISLELFTSLFVLQSGISFNPVPGQPYWMYEKSGTCRMMLVGPDEWAGRAPGRCIGLCMLQEDRTWTLELQNEVAGDAGFMQRIEAQRKRFAEQIANAGRVEEILPGYAHETGFHARILIYSLARSLRLSMQLSGIHELSCEEAAGLLPHHSD